MKILTSLLPYLCVISLGIGIFVCGFNEPKQDTYVLDVEPLPKSIEAMVIIYNKDTQSGTLMDNDGDYWAIQNEPNLFEGQKVNILYDNNFDIIALKAV